MNITLCDMLISLQQGVEKDVSIALNGTDGENICDTSFGIFDMKGGIEYAYA